MFIGDVASSRFLNTIMELGEATPTPIPYGVAMGKIVASLRTVTPGQRTRPALRISDMMAVQTTPPVFIHPIGPLSWAGVAPLAIARASATDRLAQSAAASTRPTRGVGRTTSCGSSAIRATAMANQLTARRLLAGRGSIDAADARRRPHNELRWPMGAARSARPP